MKNLKLNQIIGWSAAVAALALGACGPQAYVPGTVQSNQNAAGAMNLPPKVDIVFGVSQDGTMKNIYPGLQSEIASFVQGLEASGWDYRFVAIPLSEYMPTSNLSMVQRASVSHYDTNYGPNIWKAPYPAASFSDPLLGIRSDWFGTSFVIPGMDAAHNDAHETGLRNQSDFLNRADIKTQFLRQDAMLAMINLSTGNDHSYTQWTTCPGWETIDPTRVCAIDDPNGPANFKNSISNLKSNPLLIKHYALVAKNIGSTIHCRNGASWSGTNYINTTNAIGGSAIDICSVGVSSALAQVAQNLETTKLSFIKTYLVLGSEPSQGSIKVKKISGGTTTEIAQCANNTAGSNCWVYEGYQSNVYTITSPVPMGVASGYMIRLYGSALLYGDDTASVSYMNNGAVVSQ